MNKIVIAGLSLLAAVAAAVPADAADTVFAVVKGAKQGNFAGDTGPKTGEPGAKIAVYRLDVAGTSPVDAASGRAIGKRAWSTLKFTKGLDKSSPQFFSAFIQNETLPTVTFTVFGPARNADGRPGAAAETLIYTITLTNATVVGDTVIAPSDKDAASGVALPGAVEQVSLTFQKIQVSYGLEKSGNSADSWGI